MKKLMIAAAAAAMVSGAFADAAVYDITIKGKATTVANGKVQAYGEYWDANGNTKKGYGAILDANDKAAKICYRKSGSYSISGILFGCDCNDNTAVDVMTGIDPNEIIAALWVPSWKAELPNAAFTRAAFKRSGAKTEFVEGEIAVGFGNNGWLDMVGQGTFDVKIGMLKTISGNFVGEMDALMCTTAGKACTVCTPATPGVQTYGYIVRLCEDFAGCDRYDGLKFIGFDDTALDFTDDVTWFYGTWSVKYNASKSKKLANLAVTTDAAGQGWVKAATIKKALSIPDYVSLKDYKAL